MRAQVALEVESEGVLHRQVLEDKVTPVSGAMSALVPTREEYQSLGFGSGGDLGWLYE